MEEWPIARRAIPEDHVYRIAYLSRAGVTLFIEQEVINKIHALIALEK